MAGFTAGFGIARPCRPFLHRDRTQLGDPSAAFWCRDLSFSMYSSCNARASGGREPFSRSPGSRFSGVYVRTQSWPSSPRHRNSRTSTREVVGIVRAKARHRSVGLFHSSSSDQSPPACTATHPTPEWRNVVSPSYCPTSLNTSSPKLPSAGVHVDLEIRLAAVAPGSDVAPHRTRMVHGLRGCRLRAIGARNHRWRRAAGESQPPNPHRPQRRECTLPRRSRRPSRRRIRRSRSQTGRRTLRRRD